VGLQRSTKREQVRELVKRAELEHGVSGVEVCDVCEWNIADWITDCGAEVAAREVVPTVEGCPICRHQFYRRDLRKPEEEDDYDPWDDPDLGEGGEVGGCG
jgi:hypothetical protein